MAELIKQPQSGIQSHYKLRDEWSTSKHSYISRHGSCFSNADQKKKDQTYINHKQKDRISLNQLAAIKMHACKSVERPKRQ